MRTLLGWGVIGLLCACAARRSVTVTDARAAAEFVEHSVTFSDEVLAVSFKRSPPEGVFLSFGAPYPQQVLSVWVPMDVWKQRTEPQRTLLHRHVQVRGRPHLPATGSAPIIDVDDNAQLTFASVDERVLEPDELRAATDREAVVFALKQKLDREGAGAADELERIGCCRSGAASRATGSRSSSGNARGGAPRATSSTPAWRGRCTASSGTGS